VAEEGLMIPEVVAACSHVTVVEVRYKKSLIDKMIIL
jgi:hypothetical protein